MTGGIPTIRAGGRWFILRRSIYRRMTWRRGFATERRKSRNRILTVREFLAEVGGGGKYRRVLGQAVYLTSNARGTPHSLRHTWPGTRCALRATLTCRRRRFSRSACKYRCEAHRRGSARCWRAAEHTLLQARKRRFKWQVLPTAAGGQDEWSRARATAAP